MKRRLGYYWLPFMVALEIALLVVQIDDASAFVVFRRSMLHAIIGATRQQEFYQTATSASHNATVIHELLLDSGMDGSTELSTHTTPSRKWKNNIAALALCKQAFGSVNIPERGPNSHAVLGRFLENVRRQKHILTKQQVQDLDRLGFCWKYRSVSREEKWKESYLNLKAYKEKHGDCKVKRTYDEKLNTWIRYQRKRYNCGSLAEDRICLLDDIGFEWEPKVRRFTSEKNEEQWMQMYQKLREYRREHGHCLVPKRRRGRRLGHWVHTQRALFRAGSLRKDRQELLEELGFTFLFRETIHEEAWMAKYVQVKEYYRAWELLDNDQSLSSREKPFLSEPTRVWMWDQRRVYGKDSLDPKKKALLDDIGFHWDGPTKRPARQMNRAKDT